MQLVTFESTCTLFYFMHLTDLSSIYIYSLVRHLLHATAVYILFFLLCGLVSLIQIMSQTIKTNVIGTLNMLGLAKRVGARYDNDFYLTS